MIPLAHRGTILVLAPELAELRSRSNSREPKGGSHQEQLVTREMVPQPVAHCKPGSSLPRVVELAPKTQSASRTVHPPQRSRRAASPSLPGNAAVLDLPSPMRPGHKASPHEERQTGYLKSRTGDR